MPLTVLGQQHRRVWLLAGILLIALLLSALPTAASTLPPGYIDGDLVAISGTPHLYLVNDGKLRWLADTRAAAQLTINWVWRHEVTAAQLDTWRTTGLLGDPLLSFPLVRQDPPPPGVACCPIYLVKQESDDAQPMLFRINSRRDIELFGITTQNYQQLVVEALQFQEQYGYAVSDLAQADLAPLTPAPAATPTPEIATATEVPLASATPIPNKRVSLTLPPNYAVAATGIHISLTLPPRWRELTSAPKWRLSGQRLVTSFYPRRTERPAGLRGSTLDLERVYGLGDQRASACPALPLSATPTLPPAPTPTSTPTPTPTPMPTPVIAFRYPGPGDGVFLVANRFPAPAAGCPARLPHLSAVLWVTALPLVDYRGETPTTLIRKALEIDRIHWDYTHHDPVISWPRTIDEIMATIQDVTVADMPAVAVEYQARPPGGTWDNWQLIALRHGNVFWLFEFQAVNRRTLSRYQSELGKLLDSVVFNY